MLGIDGEAKVAQKIVCRDCGQLWAVATVAPMTLAAAEEEQRAETD